MLDAIWRVAERKIQEAIERGEFDNLPGKGRPQEFEDDSHVPDDLRIAYKILKNANCVPPELMLKKEIVQIEDMLAGIQDEQEKYRQIKKLNALVLKLNTIRRRPVNFEEQERYYGRLVDKVKVAEKKPKGEGEV